MLWPNEKISRSIAIGWIDLVRQALTTGPIYKFMPENPQACLWDERHPLRAGVFRGRQPSNSRARQFFRTECVLLIKKPPSLLGGSSLLDGYFVYSVDR